VRILVVIFFPLALLIAVTGAAAASYGPPAQTYAVTATATADGRMTGSQTITFGNSTGSPITEVWLRLWANGDGCGQRHITVSSLTGGSITGTAKRCTATKVLLTTPLQTSATAQLTLRFAIRLPHGNARLGTTNGASFYGNALPVLATTRAGVPVLNPPNELGDPFVASTARWTIDLTWPSALAAATGGVPTAATAPPGRRRAVFTSPAARDMTIAIGPWRESATTAAGTRIRMLTPNGTPARGLLAAAKASFTRMTQRYGSTGFSQFDVIVTPRLESYGMEYSGLVLTEPSKETLVHEVAHQWFSELVGSDGYAEPWLDEGPTTYAQLRDLKALGDCDFSRPFAGYGTARLTWTLGQFSRHDDWYDAVYGGAACALAKLDRDWGKGAVDGILRRWVECYRGGIATTADFIALLRERAPAGYDVDGFLRYARLTP
jgi:hypothetical protein